MKALQYAKDEAKKPYTAELAKLEARHAATILPATQLAAAAMLEAAQGVYRGLLQMSNIIDLRRMLAAETKSGNELTLALTAISASSGGGRGSSAASSAGAGGGGGGGGGAAQPSESNVLLVNVRRACLFGVRLVFVCCCCCCCRDCGGGACAHTRTHTHKRTRTTHPHTTD